jgi:hypothetical protein
VATGGSSSGGGGSSSGGGGSSSGGGGSSSGGGGSSNGGGSFGGSAGFSTEGLCAPGAACNGLTGCYDECFTHECCIVNCTCGHDSILRCDLICEND